MQMLNKRKKCIVTLRIRLVTKHEHALCRLSLLNFCLFMTKVISSAFQYIRSLYVREPGEYYNFF